MAPFAFVHLTDPHLTASGGTLYGLDPAERLRAAVADIARRHGAQGPAPAAFAVVTGDLAHDHWPEAYEQLREILSDLPFQRHLLLGNHDDRAEFRLVFPQVPVDANGFVQQAVATPVGRCLMLDTLEPMTAAGRLCRRRLDWLSDRLAEDDAPVLLFMHHPPAATGIVGMDRIPLKDADALWEVLKPHRARIRHLFHGHLHRPIAGSWHGIPLSSLRGTAHQVALDFAEETTVPGSHEPPAYAFVRVTEGDLIVHTHDFLDATATFNL